MAKAKIYTGEKTDKIAYPLGGFAAVTVKDGGKNKTRVLEGQVGYSRIYGNVVPGYDMSPGAGMSMTNFGLPRFQKNSFYAKFPFANVRLTDAGMPLSGAISTSIPTGRDRDTRSATRVACSFVRGRTAISRRSRSSIPTRCGRESNIKSRRILP